MKTQNITPESSAWTQSVSQLCHQLQTDIQNGLSEQEVAQRQKIYGPNQLPQKPLAQWWHLLIRQLCNFMMGLLFIAVCISLFLGKRFDALAIGLMIVLNGLVGFIQEYSAQRALAALKNLTKPIARVRRAGSVLTIQASNIVPGDIVILDAGDAVPADGRLVQTALLKTEEAALTGESGSIEKITSPLGNVVQLGDRKNMVFMGTHVVYGRGTMIVTSTGLNTELGAIATMLKQEQIQDTPLQKKLSMLGRQFVLLSLIFIGFSFVWGLLLGQDLLSQLIGSLSLAVAAIPEGLPIIVTIALALGVKAMARHKAIVRRLAAVETLGSVSVICTDKTGTLTKNEMMARHLWVGHRLFSISGSGYEPVGSYRDDTQACSVKVDKPLIQRSPGVACGEDGTLRLCLGLKARSVKADKPLIQSLSKDEAQHGDNICTIETDPDLGMALRIAMLCNNAHLHECDGIWSISGDPTEAALLVAAQKAGLEQKDLENDYPFIHENPFDTERKMMSVLRSSAQEGSILFVKGAPDIMLNRSMHIHINNQVVPLSSAERSEIEKTLQNLAGQGMRIIAVAYKKVVGGLNIAMESDLTFVGLFALADPPRLEVFQALEECKRAGIRTIMITGDHKETALSIARELGIVGKGAQALDGNDLDAMDQSTLQQAVRETSVYARVLAQHKLCLVKALKAQGLVVAMTGDGVNDAPAVQAADIGIAMGITGTDVTKEVADMIITDDNFASIVRAIRYGRGIYENIVKSVCYLISANTAEVLVVFLAVLFHVDSAQGQLFVGLLPIQLLWVNLITDGVPALALSADRTDASAMDRPPRPRTEAIFSQFRALQSTLVSLCIALATLGCGWYGLQKDLMTGYTMALTALIALELVRAQMVRREYNLSPFSNSWLIGAFVFSFFVHLGVLYTPLGNRIFHTVPLSGFDVLVVVGVVCAAWAVTTGVSRMIHYWWFGQSIEKK